MKHLRVWRAANDIPADAGEADLLNDLKVIEKFNREVMKVNKILAGYENIKNVCSPLIHGLSLTACFYRHTNQKDLLFFPFKDHLSIHFTDDFTYRIKKRFINSNFFLDK